MRARRYAVAALLAVGAIFLGGMLWLQSTTHGSGTPGSKSSAQPVAFGDPGPGACVPGKKMLQDAGMANQPPSSTNLNAYVAKLNAKVWPAWLTWIKQNVTSEPCVAAMANSVNVPLAQFPDWLKQNAKIAAYSAPITFENSMYVTNTVKGKKVSKIQKIGVQTFPAFEPLVQIKGVDTFKVACGNRLYPVPKSTPGTTPPGGKTTTPPGTTRTTPPACTGHGCIPTSPSPSSSCVCTNGSQTPLPPPPITGPPVPQESTGQPTEPGNPTNPGSPTPGGYNGGGPSNPVITGTPTPVITSTHSSPIPSPSGGPFG